MRYAEHDCMLAEVSKHEPQWYLPKVLLLACANEQIFQCMTNSLSPEFMHILDEAHLLFDCPQYSDERKKLLLNRSRLKACFSTRDLKAIFDLTDNINNEKETDYVSLLHLGLFAFNSFKIVRKNPEALTNSSSNIS